ncbi:hypothetical protein HFD88_001828 [Aspergillus terreus]|nr:hypothetical protein HFD88_001828 [Aspergillus terreus]
MPDETYPRWLKNAQGWAEDDDWDPDEYLKWMKRLAEAKAELDDPYREVDYSLLQSAGEAVEKARKVIIESGEHSTPRIVSDRTAKIIVRYIVAYNFFVRGTFEEVPDNSLVARVQLYFADLDIGMLDIDIARMLQAAADKREKSVGGKLDRSKIAEIINQINDEIDEVKRFKMKPELIKMLNNYFDSDEKLSIFVKYRAEPLFNTYHTPYEVKALKVLLDDGTLDRLMDQAAQLEKDKCSWDVTIGPAVRHFDVLEALRLGRTSIVWPDTLRIMRSQHSDLINLSSWLTAPITDPTSAELRGRKPINLATPCRKGNVILQARFNSA